MSNPNKRIKKYSSGNVLVIFEGIGGSGKAFVLACLQLYLALLVNVMAQIRFLVLDIDPEDEEKLGNDFSDTGECPTHSFLDELEARGAEYTGVEHLGDLQQVRRAAGASNKLYKGAQASRVLGKLAFLRQIWWYRSRYLAFLTRPIFSLRAADGVFQGGNGHCAIRNGRNGSGPQVKRRLPPVVINQAASIPGGCGSSSVMDVADIYHYLCQRQWGLTEYELYAFLLLPEVFNHDDDRLKANAWATMLEIEARYSGRRFEPLHYGTLTLDRTQPPWSGIYLWNRMNAKEMIFSGREEVVQVMAEAGRMMHFGPVGERYQGQLVNYASYPEGRFCAAAGCVRYTIETEALKQQGGLWLGRRLVNAHLLRRLAEDQAEQLAIEQVEDFCRRVGLAQLVRAFDRDVSGRPITVNLFQQFGGERRQDLVAKLAHFGHQFFPAADQALAEVRQRRLEMFRQELVQEVERQLNAPNGGALQAGQFLRRLAREVEAERQKIRQRADQIQAELEEARQPGGARRNWLVEWIKGLKKEFLARQQGAFEQPLQLKKLTAAYESYTDFLDEIRYQAGALSGWIKALQHLQAELARREQQQAADRVADRPVCVINVLCAEEEQALVEEQALAHSERAAAGLRFQWQGEQFSLVSLVDAQPISESKSLWLDEGVSLYLDYTGQFFDFSRLSVEAIWTKQEKTAADRLAEFEVLAAPLVSLDDARHPEPPKIQILGTAHGAGGYFKPIAAQANWSVVETGDPHNVDVLIVYQHLNWRLLAQAASWQEAYQRLSPTENLHVFAEWHRPAERTEERGEAEEQLEAVKEMS